MSRHAIHFITPPFVPCIVFFLSPVCVVGEIPPVCWRIPFHVTQAWCLRRRSCCDAIYATLLIFVHPIEVHSRMRLPFAASSPRLHSVSVLPPCTSACVGNLAQWAGLQKAREIARAGPDDRAIALFCGEIRCLFRLWRRFQRIQPDYSFLMHDSYVYLYLWLRGNPLFSPATLEFDGFILLSFLAFAIGIIFPPRN